MKKILLSITIAALSHPLLAEEMPFVDNDGSDFLRALSGTEESTEPRIETLVFADTQTLAVLSPHRKWTGRENEREQGIRSNIFERNSRFGLGSAVPFPGRHQSIHSRSN